MKTTTKKTYIIDDYSKLSDEELQKKYDDCKGNLEKLDAKKTFFTHGAIQELALSRSYAAVHTLLVCVLEEMIGREQSILTN